MELLRGIYADGVLIGFLFFYFRRKRYSWNPSSFKEIEHPSAFPSLLRGSTPVNDSPRPSSSLSRRDSHGSTHQLRRNDSNGAGYNYLFRKDSNTTTLPLNRRDSFGSGILSRKDSGASSHIGLARKDSADLKRPNKRDSFNEDFRRLSFGSSIYLRPDSTGATNLIRRDSFGRRDSYDPKHHRIPRDYVSKALEQKVTVTGNNNNGIETSSILRRSSDTTATTAPNDDNKLTVANLSKHVTIWEKDADRDTNRRDSSGSLSNYLASRRISIDSLDVRRNSRRGSAASGDLNIPIDTDNDKEVSVCAIIYSISNYKMTPCDSEQTKRVETNWTGFACTSIKMQMANSMYF